MSKLTKDQAHVLARQFKELAGAVSEKTIEFWNNLSDAQRQQLNDLEWSLFNASEDMLTLATKLALDDLEPALESIRRGAAKAKTVIRRVDKIKKVIEVAAAAVTLAAAIVSKNPSAIFDATKALKATVEPKKDKEED